MLKKSIYSGISKCSQHLSTTSSKDSISLCLEPRHLSRLAVLEQSRKMFNLISGLNHEQQEKSPENLG